MLTGTLQPAHGGTGNTSFVLGDMLYATGVDLLGKLAIGGVGQVLKVLAGIPAWADLFYQTLTRLGVASTQRSKLNFIPGANVSISLTDDAVNDRTDVSISASVAGSGTDKTDIEGTYGETIAIGEFVYLDPDTKWHLIDVDAAPPKISSDWGIAVDAGVLNDVKTIRVNGSLDTYAGLTAGAPVYASGTAGGYTQTRPTVTAGGGTKVIAQIGVAISTSAILVEPGPVDYYKREILSDDESMTIEHFSDAAEHQRIVTAYSYLEEITNPDEYALRTDLIAWWELEEDSTATRVDSHGSNDLTQTNTPTAVAGVINNANNFVRANSEYLSRADNTDLSTGDIDFSFSCWARITTKPGSGYLPILSKDVAGQREYALMWSQANDRFNWYLLNATGNNQLVANALGSPSTATWYHIAVWHDSVNNVIGIRIDDTFENTMATTLAPMDSTTAFTIGRWFYDVTFNGYWDGDIDEVVFAKRVWTATDITTLYNGGAGLSYADTEAVYGNPYRTPLTIGKWDGTDDRDLAVRFDGGAGADAATKTTVKNVTGVESDVTVRVRLL
jgi:hypothetical protein